MGQPRVFLSGGGGTPRALVIAQGGTPFLFVTGSAGTPSIFRGEALFDSAPGQFDDMAGNFDTPEISS
jgi:hypothetical protein